MRTAELIKLLKKHGCYQTDEGARHQEWFSPKTGKYTRVGRHLSQEIATGTAHRILKEMGIK